MPFINPSINQFIVNTMNKNTHNMIIKKVTDLSIKHIKKTPISFKAQTTPEKII